MATMKPEVAIMQVLLANGAITALTSTRVYAGYAPESATEPFVIVRRASTAVDNKQSNPSGRTGLREVQCDIWITGPNYENITDIATLIEDGLYSDAHRQTITDGADSITFSKCFITDQSDENEMIDDGTGRPIRRILQRWELSYQN